MSFRQANRKSHQVRSWVAKAQTLKQWTGAVMKEMVALSVLLAAQVSLVVVLGALI